MLLPLKQFSYNNIITLHIYSYSVYIRIINNYYCYSIINFNLGIQGCMFHFCFIIN